MIFCCPVFFTGREYSSQAGTAGGYVKRAEKVQIAERLSRGISSTEWVTVGLIMTCYLLWGLAGLVLMPLSLPAGLAAMAVLTALHSSLTHEALHGHPTRCDLVNEFLVCLPLSVFYPYRRYKMTHIAHHRDETITDPIEDPESYYKTRFQYDRLPLWLRHLFRLNNSLLGRVTAGPVLSVVIFYADDIRRLARAERGVVLSWMLHLPAAAIVLALVGAMGLPIWLYLVAVVWPALGLISLRSFAEHRWHDRPEGRTIIVEKSWLSLVFLNNNLHLVHHAHPDLPWYQLPLRYQAEKQRWQARSCGYVFPDYTALWMRWAVCAKEPVLHPSEVSPDDDADNRQQ